MSEETENTMDRFTNRILNYIREQQLTEKGDTVIVGFSGGADSVCLLHVLWELRRLLGISIRAVHVNHGIRGEEALRDEAFCEAMAVQLGVPFESVRVNVPAYVSETGTTEEEAGRILRYEALGRSAAKVAAEQKAVPEAGSAADRQAVPEAGSAKPSHREVRETAGRVLIATAHHADDQAETILMNMLRGSGLRGMGGMRPKRDNIIRPLLAAGRKDITEYLDRRRTDFVEDSTNFENDHTRNRLRNIILPQLREYVNSRASQHIAWCGELAAEADEFISSEAVRFLNEECTVYEDAYGTALRLGQRKLKEKAQIFRRYVIIEALRRLGIPMKDWGEKHFADIDSALFGSGGFHVDLPGGVYAENEYKETVLHTCRREESDVKI